MEIFKASVQYNDLIGSSAADLADQLDARKWLKNNGHINDDEILIGIKVWIGENHGVHKDPVSVHFFVSTLDGFANIPEKFQAVGEPIKTRDIQIDMAISDFLALFKRLEITLSVSGMLEGKSYSST